MNSKNEVFEYLIDQLRQQVNSNQCEDQAHEVQSLKNQLRDASALVAELQGDNIKKSEHISHLTWRVKELHLALVQATGDVEAYKLIRGQEQSGCRKEDAQVEKSWVEHDGAAACPVPDDTVVDIKFRNGEVASNTKALGWSWGTSGGPYEIVAYRVAAQQCNKDDTRECAHDWVLDEKGDYFICAKCGKQEAELIDCRHTNTVGLRKGFAPGFTKKCLDCGAKLK